MLKTQKKLPKILIVEDDAFLSKILLSSFVDNGFEAEMVLNGWKAEEMVKKFKPDIVLLDLMLPGIDGFSVLKILKDDKSTKNIPVIVLSNLSSAGDIASARQLGAEEYLVKAEISLEEIIEIVKKKFKK